MNTQDGSRFKDNDKLLGPGVLIAVQKIGDSYGNVLWSLLFLVFCGPLADALAQGNKVDRDWTKHPAVVESDFTQDLFVVGDAHGDNDRLTKALKGAGIITGKTADPADVKWAAGRAVVVFTGDLIDKGKHSLDVITLVRSLRSAATAKGGQVVVL